jgi:enterochelin esterase family protein
LLVDPSLDASPGQRFVDRNADAVGRADPRNPRRLRDPDDPHPRSVLELPGAGPEIWLARAVNSPRGRLERHSLASDQLGNEHALDVYLPAGYGSRSDRLPLLIVFDGESYVETLPGPRLLDALIGGAAIPPLVALFLRNATRDSRSWELPCNPDFADFLAREILPWLRAHYRIREEPDQVALAGSSFGGIAATCAALRHPELFGKVLSQSGAYWWTFPRDARDFDGSLEPGWISRRFAERERLPLRFYLSAGLFERAESGFGILETARGFRDVLQAKGYPVEYREFAGGHDHLAWRADLPQGLIALFGRARAAAEELTPARLPTSRSAAGPSAGPDRGSGR